MIKKKTVSVLESKLSSQLNRHSLYPCLRNNTTAVNEWGMRLKSATIYGVLYTMTEVVWKLVKKHSSRFEPHQILICQSVWLYDAVFYCRNTFRLLQKSWLWHELHEMKTRNNSLAGMIFLLSDGFIFKLKLFFHVCMFFTSFHTTSVIVYNTP